MSDIESKSVDVVSMMEDPATTSPESTSQLTDKQLLKSNNADDVTQAARLRSLNGVKLLFVSGSGLYPSMGRSIWEHNKYLLDHGVQITMVFQSNLKNDKYFLTAEKNHCYTHAVFADMKGPKAAENIAAASHCQGPFDGVFTPHEATQRLNAAVQRLVGCPGNDPKCYDVAQDKYATRRALAEAGLNTLKASQIWGVEDCAAAAENVGFPMIVKPSTGMGSMGVFKADDAAALESAVKRIIADIASSWCLSGAASLSASDSSESNAAPARSVQAPILAETFVDPTTFGQDGLITEFDVECLLWDGELMYANVVDNWSTLPPYFQDRGFNAPSVTPKQIQQEMIEYSAKACKALGFERGNFHMECWYTPAGPILIEANPRVGGGSINDTHINVWGVDPMTNFVLAMLDIPINPPRLTTPKCLYGFALVNAGKTGTLTTSDFCATTKDSEIIRSVDQFKHCGDHCVGLDTGVPEWLAQIDFATKELNNNTSVQDFLTEMSRVIDLTVNAASEHTMQPLL